MRELRRIFYHFGANERTKTNAKDSQSGKGNSAIVHGFKGEVCQLLNAQTKMIYCYCKDL